MTNRRKHRDDDNRKKMTQEKTSLYALNVNRGV